MAVRSPLPHAVRALGWWNGTLYLVGRILSRLTRGTCFLVKYEIVAQPVRAQPVLSRASGNVEVRRVGPEATVVRSFPRPPKVIGWRFANGGVPFVATKHDEFAGFLWLHERPYEEDEVRCLFRPLPSNEAVWDYDVYVVPTHRLGRTFVRLWDAAHSYLRERGVRWTLSRISAFNAESLSAHTRLGAQRIASATFVALGPIQLSLFTRRPFVHVSATSVRRPTLDLDVPGDGDAS